MDSSWVNIISVCYIFIFMFIAKFIKEKFGIFRSIIIPTSLLAGFIGLVLSDEMIGLIQYDQGLYADIVYHCLGIGFIALTLTSKEGSRPRDSVTSGLFIISNYCFQGVLGMAVVFVLTLLGADYFLGLGLMLPLAFGQGPGFASNIGNTWDKTLSIGFAQQYGLTLATVGFLVGGLVGIVLLNIVARRQGLQKHDLKKVKGLQTKEITLVSVKEINFYDNLTMQTVWIAMIYFVSLNVMHQIAQLLSGLGNLGVTIAGLINGFNYLFGILIAIVFKFIMSKLSRRGHRTNELVDGMIMHNIASISFHIMIAASVMAISITTIKEYYDLLIVVAVCGAVGALIFIIFVGRIAFNRHPWYYILAMFGMMTGTASTGLALLRGVDRELETDVATNLVLGSAIAAPLGLPMMVLLSFPVVAYTENNNTYYYVAFFGLLAYLLLILTIMLIRSKLERKRMEL